MILIKNLDYSTISLYLFKDLLEIHNRNGSNMTSFYRYCMLFILTLHLLLPAAVCAQEAFSYTPRMELLPGWGEIHHPVTTQNREAQQFFDQGLAMLYSFAYEGAYRSFQKAAELDPQLAMAYWGMALAMHPSINGKITAQQEASAYQLIKKAMTLASRASTKEQEYIQALAERYSNAPDPDYLLLDRQYSQAMKKLSHLYPDDPDAAALFAESVLVLNPWNQWTLDGQPNEGTLEVVEILKSVLKKDPEHTGANHYYIHAIEASPHPEDGLKSADVLRNVAPASGHLLHMSSHIYFLLGEFSAAVESNLRAIAAEKVYAQQLGMNNYFPAHYYHMLVNAYSMEGRFNDAMLAAAELSKFFDGNEHRTFILTLLLLQRFHRWQEILQFPQPSPQLAVTTAVWHAARAMAYAALGSISEAYKEKQLFMKSLQNLPPNTLMGFNKTEKIMKIEEYVLDASLAKALHQNQTMLESLQKAIEEEDSLAYSIPPDWPYPVREILGGELLREKKYQEAEIVFRKELKKHPQSGRALFGLMESLKGEGKYDELSLLQKDYEKAWKNADKPLTVGDL